VALWLNPFCVAKTNPDLFFIKRLPVFPAKKYFVKQNKNGESAAKQNKVHSFNLNFCIEKNSTKTFLSHPLVALDKFSTAYHYDMEWYFNLLGQ
jgi:hypothetical protein